MVRNLIEAKIREIIINFIKKDEEFYIFANNQELFIFFKNLQCKNLQKLRVKIGKTIETILKIVFYDIDKNLIKLKSFQYQNKMYLQRLTDLKNKRRKISQKNLEKKKISQKNLELNLKEIDRHFIKHINFFKQIGAVIIKKDILQSKKYRFTIKKGSICVFDRKNRKFFSMNYIINNENENENNKL